MHTAMSILERLQGHDGGPVLQLKALNEQFSKRYLEIMRKYEQKLKDSEDKK